MLTGDLRGKTAYREADLREPQKILDESRLAEVLDLSEPVGLLLIAVLHFIRDDDNPRQIVDTIIDALPAGSAVATTHVTLEYMSPERYAAVRATAEQQSAARSGTELASLFVNPRLRLVEPGVQSVAQWWPQDVTQPRIEDVPATGFSPGSVSPESAAASPHARSTDWGKSKTRSGSYFLITWRRRGRLAP